MSRDEIVTGAVIVAFAALVTLHVTLVLPLATRAPRWHAAAALVVPPLAPYWGWQDRRKRSVAWIASALVYLAAFLLASR